MIHEKEAEQIIHKLFELRQTAKESKNRKVKAKLAKQEKLCVEAFDYIVQMHTNRYKSFPNYEDLKQEGREAIVKALKTYQPGRGNIFWWLNRYIETKILRSANSHTAIRYPMHVAKRHPPHRESEIPVMIEEHNCPDLEVESLQEKTAVHQGLECLEVSHQEIVKMHFGFGTNNPMSVSRICKKLKIPRVQCLKVIEDSLALMRERIKL